MVGKTYTLQVSQRIAIYLQLSTIYFRGTTAAVHNSVP